MGQEAGSLSPTALSVSLVADCIWPARVALTDRTREVVAHAATGPERAQLWERSRSLDANRCGYARRRSSSGPVVVHERGTESV
jgi:hypothetical protein